MVKSKSAVMLFWGAFTLNLVGVAYVAQVNIGNNVKSGQKVEARAIALETVAKHNISDTCWEINRNTSFKLGDLIETVGTTDGKIPTSCVYAPRSRQFLSVGYENSLLVVQFAFSEKEVKAEKSNIKNAKKGEWYAK